MIQNRDQGILKRERETTLHIELHRSNTNNSILSRAEICFETTLRIVFFPDYGTAEIFNNFVITAVYIMPFTKYIYRGCTSNQEYRILRFADFPL